MLFNTAAYALFLPLVFLIYWALAGKLRWQNIFVLACSYFFYACWDWRFLFLLAFSTALDYATGLMIHAAASESRRRVLLVISVSINLGFLAVFKYYNFFAQSWIDLMAVFDLVANPAFIEVILPVGISFYTFHGLSYAFDVYNRKIQPTRNFTNYALFVSFFPLLVAGPIERATHLLPQVERPRTFSIFQAVDGLKQILWGLFKKVVIADNCAEFANIAFSQTADLNGSTLALGAVFFAFQIYGDFSGYTDIALGSARLLGIELLQNFSYPYFSRSIAEFWRRWHISLSSWFRDYLYIPLGGSKGGIAKVIRNTFIIFVVSGFWHGANWTFIIWGALNALYIIPSVVMRRNRRHSSIVAEHAALPTPRELWQMTATFLLTTFAWIFFRATSLGHAWEYISNLFSPSLFSAPQFFPKSLSLCLVLFVIVEWLGRRERYALQSLLARLSLPVRWSVYTLLVFVVVLFSGQDQEFIYFQF